MHKLEISWRIPKESKQSKVRQDRYCSTQKQKEENSINILAIQHAFTRIFNDTEKLSSDSSKSLSHTLQTKKLSNSPTDDARSLSLSLSPAPYGGKFKPEWARVLGIAPPNPSGYKILGIKFDNHGHPKN